MIVDSSTIDGVIDKLKTFPLIACDTETTGLGQADRLFAIIMFAGGDVYYFDKRVVDVSKLRSLFLSTGIHWVFHNAKFDMRMLDAEGLLPEVDMLIIEDTEVLARLENNSHLGYRLKDLGAREGFPKSAEVKEYIRKHRLSSFADVPLDIMQSYAENDAIITFNIRNNLVPRIEERSQYIRQLESELTKVCYRMERAGVRLDKDYTERALAHEEGIIRALKTEFQSSTNREYSESKDTLVPVFLEAGETVPKTAKGNWSLTDDILEEYTSPIARLVQRIRHHEKRCSTYYRPFLEKEYYGLIHADMRQAGTTTGRFSYRDPNLQNIPKEDDVDESVPFVVRGCLIPRSGRTFISIDYEQQEYRMMLAYAKHRRLIAEVMAGADIHEATARVFGITRKQAKTLNFAILYGAGLEKLAGMLGVSVNEARRMRREYFKALPEVEIFIDLVKRIAQSRGHIYTWAGRKLCFPEPSFSYAAPNHLIQGGCADVVKRAMLKVYQDVPELRADGPYQMILQVHDQLLFDIPNEMLEIVPKIKGIMEDVFPTMNGMKLTASVSVSEKSFAERDMVAWKSL